MKQEEEEQERQVRQVQDRRSTLTHNRRSRPKIGIGCAGVFYFAIIRSNGMKYSTFWKNAIKKENFYSLYQPQAYDASSNWLLYSSA
ncbi:MAG: hypothetical protein LUF27_04905 [Lachnospiraceae bacterium]|nr:hypothetical protein [Lachnospiraceae bacterium]